jgi:hypothetical protein
VNSLRQRAPGGSQHSGTTLSRTVETVTRNRPGTSSIRKPEPRPEPAGGNRSPAPTWEHKLELATQRLREGLSSRCVIAADRHGLIEQADNGITEEGAAEGTREQAESGLSISINDGGRPRRSRSESVRPSVRHYSGTCGSSKEVRRLVQRRVR